MGAGITIRQFDSKDSLAVAEHIIEWNDNISHYHIKEILDDAMGFDCLSDFGKEVYIYVSAMYYGELSEFYAREKYAVMRERFEKWKRLRAPVDVKIDEVK